ncbi:MAG: hypothetical protein QHI38_06945 [Armatimonadota bacterium]|nr:hypothetical protein [Armatimonadota bacterium]
MGFGLADKVVLRRTAVVIVALLVLITGTGCTRKPIAASKAVGALEGRSAQRKGKETKPVRSPEEKLSQPVESSRPSGLPSLETVVKRVTIRWTDKNKMTLSATAAKLEGSEVTRKAVMTNFSAELYQDGKLTTTLAAPKVEADEARRTLTAAGGVTLKSLDRGTVVKCAWVKWYARENRIVGDGGVKVTSKLASGAKYEMEGAAFQADTALKNITITDSARGWIGE